MEEKSIWIISLSLFLIFVVVFVLLSRINEMNEFLDANCIITFPFLSICLCLKRVRMAEKERESEFLFIGGRLSIYLPFSLK